MQPNAVVGVEAFLTFFSVLVTATVFWKGKSKRLEGMVLVGSATLLCVLLGTPLLQHSSFGYMIHLPGPVLGVTLGTLIHTYLVRGKAYPSEVQNDLAAAHREIHNDAREASDIH